MTGVRKVAIKGTGEAVPEKLLTNEDLEGMVDTSDEWIITRTGIKERRIADERTATSDLAAVAARQALANAGLAASDLDLIMLTTITPDMLFPASACFLQATLGAKRAAAFDLSAGCSGFVYGLEMGMQVVAAGCYDNVLVVGADCLSKVINWSDRSTCVLFGDGAGAVVLGPTDRHNGYLAGVLGADGGGADLLRVSAGGSRHPATHSTVDAGMHYMEMAGNEVFKFAVRIVPEVSQQVLDRAGLSVDDVDLMIPHQANIRIIDAAARKLGIPQEKVYVNVQNYGNTGAASVPIALHEALQEGRISDGDVLLLVGFGAGLTWGASLIRWVEE